MSLSAEAKTNEKPISSERKQSSFLDLSVSLRSSFAAEFCNPDIGAEYRFENLSFEVVDKRKNKQKNHTKSDLEGTKHKLKHHQKQILKGISGSCTAGEMLAILGPSGAGKTTLLNMLTLEATNGTGFGDITLNGTPLSRNNFVRNCYYVPQEGSHYAFLTPRETLTYAASLFSKDDSEKINRRVNTLLEVMGLKSCADVKVGNAFFQGLSGGQKKRLSVAVALLSQPLVLFLDEPTSGLDAAAASGIMEFLRDLASMANIMIICTIHQPSSDVFYAFDKVMLLTNGELAYLGSANNVIPYFKTIGHTMPQNSNPAEWILDLVNDEFTSPAQVSRILFDWHSKGIAYMATTSDPNIPAELERSKSTRNVAQEDRGNAPNFISQLWTLIKRHGLLVARDPTIYTGRCLIFMFMAIFFSIVYINQRERTQTQVLNKMWLCLWFVGPASSLSVIAVYATNMEFKSVKNEIKNGMVRPMEYIVSNILLQIPLMFAVTWLGYLIPAYAISNFDPNQLPTFLMILCVSFLIFEGAANTMGVYFDNFLVGMLGIMNMWFASFLFSGIMVQENDVPWPLRVFMFIMPFKWSLSSLIYTEFHELTFRGSYYYSDLPTISTFINNTSSSSTGLFINTNSTMLSNTTTSTQSFYCPYVAPQQCYGPTGIDALNTLHSNWGTVSSQDNVGRNFGILIAMYVVYKFSFAMAVYMKATVAAHIQPHSKSISAEQESQRVQAIGLDIPVKIVDDIDNDSSFQLVASERERLLRQGDFVREFANPDINAEFIFENVFYEVADPKNKTEKNAVKQIIKGVSGGVKAGEILTIMGPSGAGKTTLLNLLTLEATTGQSYGSITLNGRELTRELFLQNCFYVPQYPALYAFLTPRETLMITARLFETKDKDGNTEEIIAKRVNTLLEVMGLQSCADIKIGNEFFLGLSGGQKKRLSVAVALLSRPLVLFLDEPTTGLDAAAAAGLMKLLQQLATSAKILVVATIHQPSDQVFANFDNIMLLARGEVAYQGPASRVAPYFQQIGYPMPDKATPAEYMLDLINDEFTSPERVASVVSAWSHHSTDVRLADRGASHLPRPIRGASMASQIILLLQRQSMLVVRDPMLYIGRMIAYLFANMFFCAVYYAARDRAQSRVIPRMFNDMWCIGTAASMALIIVFGQNREIHTIKNEVKNGMLSPFSYVIANTILQIPILFLMVIVGYLLPFYAVMLSNPDHLGEMIVIITVMLWSFEALAELLAVQYENFLIGMLMFLNFWFSSFLFSGVIAAESQVPWPLKIFLYISPLRYGLETMVYLDFVGDTYGDAQFSDQAPGYVCNNGRTGAACFGRSGSQVLRSLHSNFETMDDKNLVLRDVLICLLIGGAIKLLYVGMLWQKVTTVQLPKPSAGKVAQVMKTPKMNDDHKMETIATAAAATATATATAATIHIHASTVASHIAANKVEKHIDGAGADAVAVGVASPTPPDQAATTTTTTPTPTPAASLSTSTQTPIPATESFRVRNDSIESDADAVELDIISGAEQPNRHPSTHVVFHTIQQQ